MGRTLRQGIVAAMCLAAGVSWAHAVGPNLLANPSFSSGSTSWSAGNSVALTVHPETGSTLPGGSGPPCLEARNSGTQGNFGGAMQSVKMTAGHQYLIAASAYLPRAGNGASRVGVILTFYDASSTSITQTVLSAVPLPFEDWQRFEGAVVAPAGTVTAVVNFSVQNPRVDPPSPKAVALFDDTFVGEMAEPKQEVNELFLPVASAKVGQNGTYWKSDVWLTSTASTPLSVKAAVLYPGQDNSAAIADAKLLRTFIAGATWGWGDLVSQLGAANVTGALYLRAETPATETPRNLVRVVSRNSTANPSGEGAYGQAVNGVKAGTLGQAVASGMWVGDESRTNIGVVNTSAEAITVGIEVRDRDGLVVKSTAWSLQPYEPRMLSAASLGITKVSNGAVAFWLVGQSGSFRGFISVVDNMSNDSIYIPAE